MDVKTIDTIVGAAELVAWFGRFPRFHDAYILDFQLRGDGSGHIRLHGWNMTDKIDEKGFYILDKHFVADLIFEEAVSVHLEEFLPGFAIVSDLHISEMDDGFEIAIESSYGFAGSLKVKNIHLKFEPGKPS